MAHTMFISSQVKTFELIEFMLPKKFEWATGTFLSCSQFHDIIVPLHCSLP